MAKTDPKLGKLNTTEKTAFPDLRKCGHFYVKTGMFNYYYKMQSIIENWKALLMLQNADVY